MSQEMFVFALRDVETTFVQQLSKCYVKVTDPDLAKGCSDLPDSAYYLYSIPGFSPCYFFDFDTVVPMKYMLECRTNDGSPMSEYEMSGYEYRDVVSPPEYNPF